MATFESRVGPNGAKVVRAKVRLKGYPPQSASFTRLTDARRWAQSTESAIREGRHFKTNEAKRHTLAEAIDRYSREVLPHKAKAGANQKAQLAWWRQNLGHYLLADVTPALIAEYRNRLMQEPKTPKSKVADPDAVPVLRTPATVVRYLAALSHVLSVAIKDWGWLESNAALKIRKPKEPRGRDRYLNTAERTRLLTACRETSVQLYLVLVLALSTGMRRGEILELRWGQIDLDRRQVHLEKTKNGERRTVPLASLALQLLSAAKKDEQAADDLVFPGSAEGRPFDIQKPWYAALDKARIENFRFHDLRHSAASYLAMNGATSLEIAAVLGHKTLAMVKRYAHVAEQHTAKVVAAMNQTIFGGHDHV